MERIEEYSCAHTLLRIQSPVSDFLKNYSFGLILSMFTPILIMSITILCIWSECISIKTGANYCHLQAFKKHWA